jgi:hypothetical protein
MNARKKVLNMMSVWERLGGANSARTVPLSGLH